MGEAKNSHERTVVVLALGIPPDSPNVQGMQPMQVLSLIPTCASQGDANDTAPIEERWMDQGSAAAPGANYGAQAPAYVSAAVIEGSVVTIEEVIETDQAAPAAAPPVLSLTDAQSPGTGLAEPLLTSAHMGSGWTEEPEAPAAFAPALARETELGILGDHVCLTGFRTPALALVF